MKVNNLFVTALLASALVFFGCKTASDDSSSDDGITAPTVSTATDLAATGGTAPTTQDAAKTLFTGATTALNTLVSDSASSKSVASKKAGARTAGTTTETIPYDYNSTDGTLSYSGSIAITSYQNPVTPVANTTYNNYFTFSCNGTVNGTIKNAKVTSNGVTYTISGVVKNVISETASLNIKTGSSSSDTTYSIDLALGLGIGTALSVKRSDGVGAKFIISYAANYAKNGITSTDSSFDSAISDYLKAQPATLTVYDDANTVIYKSTLTGTEVLSTSLLDGISD